ncbi:rod-determining factor RdfA [Haloarchaeobius salinus]|uniref:rod-determining factor RdfA n=1 Tax=Haloarchaeobius salinus TaxID=1198298 RepID=UPI0026E547D5|nr:rod-determining factor RdfA [Haloarchaeobius salinus]
MVPPNRSGSSASGRRLKVVRLIDEYDLYGVGDTLEEQWTAEENRLSLRKLADYFNEELIRSELERADTQLLNGEVENIYRLLTDDTVSSAERTRGRRRLEQAGVDVDELESDFVTYQAIRTYLLEHREAAYERRDVDPIEREVTNLQQLRGRVVSVADGKVKKLRDNGELTLGEFKTMVNIQILCEECNARFDVFELLERGGCRCEEE